MANIRNKHASLPSHKIPLDARAYYEDIADSVIPVYPIYIYRQLIMEHAKLVFLTIQEV